MKSVDREPLERDAPIRASRHAVERYALHHPGADEVAVIHGAREGLWIPHEIVSPLLNRPLERLRGSNYRLSPDRRGLFALTKGGAAWVVVTYLRFGAKQRAFASRHWPPDDAPAPAPPPPPSTEQAPSDAQAAEHARSRALRARLAEVHPTLGHPTQLALLTPGLAERFPTRRRARIALLDLRDVTMDPTSWRLSFTIDDPDGQALDCEGEYVKGRVRVGLAGEQSAPEASR